MFTRNAKLWAIDVTSQLLIQAAAFIAVHFNCVRVLVYMCVCAHWVRAWFGICACGCVRVLVYMCVRVCECVRVLVCVCKCVCVWVCDIEFTLVYSIRRDWQHSNLTYPPQYANNTTTLTATRKTTTNK